MVNIQIQGGSEPARDALAQVARSCVRSMRDCWTCLLEDEARLAANVTLLQRLRAVGGNHTGTAGETARELDALRGMWKLRVGCPSRQGSKRCPHC